MTDQFKRTPLRVLGYGYAIAEALKYRLGEELYYMCFNVATGFIVVHTFYSASLAASDKRSVVSAIVDTLLWEGLSSALIPTLISYNTEYLTRTVLSGTEGVPEPLLKWGPGLMALIMLNLTMEPVDELVNRLLNETFRPFYT